MKLSRLPNTCYLFMHKRENLYGKPAVYWYAVKPAVYYAVKPAVYWYAVKPAVYW